MSLPAEAWYNVLETGATEKLGSFQVAQAQDLQYVLLTMLKSGAWVGSEQLRLKIYPTSSYATALYTSDWRDLDAIGTAEPSYWQGRVRFDFSTPVPLNPNLTYYLAVETTNYTRTSTFFVAAKLDWPDAVYSSSAATRRGAQAVFCGIRQTYRTTEQGGTEPMGQLRRLQIAEGVTLSAPTDLQASACIDFTWTAAATQMDVDVSAYVADARKVGWTLSRPSGENYLQIGCDITKTSATNVRINVDEALATGTYRLTGTY